MQILYIECDTELRTRCLRLTHSRPTLSKHFAKQRSWAFGLERIIATLECGWWSWTAESLPDHGTTNQPDGFRRFGSSRVERSRSAIWNFSFAAGSFAARACVTR